MGFPGIFSSIDAYTKSVVEHHFKRTGTLPDWMAEVGGADEIVPIRASEFKTERGDVTLTGVPDLILRDNGSYTIVDYKTARYTGNQDALMPIYKVQLNAYAYIAESLGMKPVGGLFLVYFEPPHRDHFDGITATHTDDDGFEMPFRPRIHKLEKDLRAVERLIDRAGKAYNSDSAPRGIDGCEECAKLDALIASVLGRS